MESAELRQRKQATKDTAELLRLSTKPPTEPHLKHGVPMQLLRSLILATWFNCCVVVICVTQLIGCPLYVINRRYYYLYMAYTKQCFALVLTAVTQWSSPTLIRVSGDASVRGQIHLSKDGLLETCFPERLVMIANHQVYTDWIYLWWVAYTNAMHGRIFIILKESLKYIPVVGTGMMFYGFIFMARKWVADKPRLQHRLEKLKTNFTGSNSARPTYDPMWLLLFPEGTNLSLNTKGRSDVWSQKQGLPSFKHEILPRTTGLFFCLQQLRGTVDWVYDCTIAYEGPPNGSYPDKYFTLRSTYLQGRPPTSVNMHWRRFQVSKIPLEDQKEFEAWLIERWAEKDQLMDEYFETGRFPSELAGSVKAEHATDGQQVAAEAGFVESFTRLHHWSELGLIFVVLLSVASFCKLVTSRLQ